MKSMNVSAYKELQTEHQEAVNVAEYLDDLQRAGKILLYSHVPNETFTKNWGTKMKNKREGVRSGVPDYIVVTMSYVLFIELKRRKKSKVSPQQDLWVLHLKAKKTDSTICYGSDEVIKYVNGYLYSIPV